MAVMGPVETAIRAGILQGQSLHTAGRGARFLVADFTETDAVLMLAPDSRDGPYRTPLPWDVLEDVVRQFRGRGWVRVTGDRSSPDKHTFAGFVQTYGYGGRAAGTYVAVLLEAAGVVELDHRRPLRLRVTLPDTTAAATDLDW